MIVHLPDNLLLVLSANNADNQQITTSTPNFTPKSAKLGVVIYS